MESPRQANCLVETAGDAGGRRGRFEGAEAAGLRVKAIKAGLRALHHAAAAFPLMVVKGCAHTAF